MTTKPLKKGATYDDLRDVPDHFVAEMFDGDLYASPRPTLPHANAAGSLSTAARSCGSTRAKAWRMRGSWIRSHTRSR